MQPRITAGLFNCSTVGSALRKLLSFSQFTDAPYSMNLSIKTSLESVISYTWQLAGAGKEDKLMAKWQDSPLTSTEQVVLNGKKTIKQVYTKSFTWLCSLVVASMSLLLYS